MGLGGLPFTNPSRRRSFSYGPHHHYTGWGFGFVGRIEPCAGRSDFTLTLPLWHFQVEAYGGACDCHSKVKV